MEKDSEFETRIESGDVGLFAHIDSQTSDADRRVLLAIQRSIRRCFPRYVYLEIGSHLGGTIQPHLLDRRCSKIYSIDSRPTTQPDTRGVEQTYIDNSTERMLEGLRSLAPDQVSKVVCFESQAHDIAPSSIIYRPQICFIDGEHTDNAVASDFEFCLSVVDPDGVIVFHDADLVCHGIQSITSQLRRTESKHKAFKLDGSVYAISLGDCPVTNDRTIRHFVRNARFYFIKSGLMLGYRRYRNRRRAGH